MAYSEPIDNVLSKLSCYDEDIKALLIEAIGYSFYRRNELSASFFLVGDKANGKSTYLTMIETLLGQSNTTSLGLEDLTERFYKVMLVGKLACNGDDISDNALRGKPLSEFKKLVSGNSTLAENKGKDAFTHKPYCKFFFSCNNPPDLYDPTGAVMRRIVYIPMRAKFTKQDKDYDPYIISKLTSEKSMEYLIQLALAGLKRVLKNNDFTHSDLSDEALEQYEEQNNSVVAFMNEHYHDSIDTLSNYSINEVYNEYLDYCSTNRIEEVETRTKFSRTICIRYNMKTQPRKRDGKSLRCFVSI
jgi:putative DNA primase/helicase